MTRTTNLDAASVASLMKASNAIQLANDLMRDVVLLDSRQGDLFDAGADLACEDFVAERKVLKDRIEALSDELVDVSNALHRAKAECDTANAVFAHVSDFANQLQAGLGQLGISYQADVATGEPRFTVNLRVLDGAVRDMIERS